MAEGDQAGGRQRILEQAEKLFLAHGYHGVSIRDIVQACGLPNAALYYHFGSKQMLFVQVFREYVVTLVQKLQEAGDGTGSCGERLTRIAVAYAQLVLDAHAESRILARDLMELDSEEARHLILDTEGQIPFVYATVLEQGIAAGEIRVIDAPRVSVMLLGMINSLTARRMFGKGTGTLREDIELAIRTLLEGIGA